MASYGVQNGKVCSTHDWTIPEVDENQLQFNIVINQKGITFSHTFWIT